MANKLQKGMQDFGIKQALKYLEKDPEENIPKLMEMVDRFAPQGWYEGQRNMIRKVIQEKGNWYELILRLYELDPGVRKAFFQNFIFNASLNGSALQDQLSQEITVIFRGQFCLIRHQPAICIVQDAGLQSTDIS